MRAALSENKSPTKSPPSKAQPSPSTHSTGGREEKDSEGFTVLPSSAHATSELASSLRQLKDKWDSGGAGGEGGEEPNSSGSGGVSPGGGDGQGGSEASHSKSFMSPLAKKSAAAAAQSSGEGGEGDDDGEEEGGGDPAMSLRAATARLHVLEKEVGEAHGREAELREELVQARAEIRRLRGLVQEYEEGFNPGGEGDPQRRATIGGGGDNDGEDGENAEPNFEEVRKCGADD